MTTSSHDSVFPPSTLAGFVRAESSSLFTSVLSFLAVVKRCFDEKPEHTMANFSCLYPRLAKFTT
jgi:hypothetical protein